MRADIGIFEMMKIPDDDHVGLYKELSGPNLVSRLGIEIVQVHWCLHCTQCRVYMLSNLLLLLRHRHRQVPGHQHNLPCPYPSSPI